MIPGELKRLYQQGRMIPFVGAGASMSVTWDDSGQYRRGPSWRELVDEAATQLGYSPPDLLRVRGSDLQILEYYKRRKGGLGPLNSWLASSMHPPDGALLASPIHKSLAALSKCKLFYTTNFDDLLERSLELFGRKTTVVAKEEERGAEADTCEIVKFHGDLRHHETMVLSEQEYQHRLAFSTPMDFRLLGDLMNRAILFVGYSFSDPNVSYLFFRVNEALGQLPNSVGGQRAYILVPNASNFEIVLFSQRNISVIQIDGGDQTASTASALQELAAP